MQDSINALLTKYQKDEPTLTAAAKDTKQKAIQAFETEFQAKQLKFQKQFDERHERSHGADHRPVKKVIDDIRVEDGYAIILDNAPGAGNIVSADKNLDITDVSSRVCAPRRRPRYRRRRRRSRVLRPARRRHGSSSGEAADAVISSASGNEVAGGEGEFALTAAAIAELVGGQLVGEPSTLIDGVAPLDRASPRHLTFLGVAKYAPMLAT